MSFRSDGTPIQRSVAINPKHYATSNMYTPKLGVILDVRYADDPQNRSSYQYNDFRGFLAEAQVFLVDDSTILERVFIPPDSPTGLDNFEELLPRPSSKTVTGQVLSDNLSQIDVCDLDGDWCIVEFLNGNIQSPFISRYWPNPRNVFDCATSGKGNPVFSTSQGRALDQRGRYFRRTNGVEYVVTKDGNIWISTYRAGNTLALQDTPSKDGRFPRLNNGQGGSILVNVKPSQLFELSFNEQVDGVGSDSLADSSLPQKNPAIPPPIPKLGNSTKLQADKDKIKITVPSSFVIESKDEIRLDAVNKITQDAPEIHLGENSTDMAAMAQLVLDRLTSLTNKVNDLITAFNAHTHLTAGTGTPVPPTGVPGQIPVISATPPQSVAADKVFVE
jgi:hypothetical protein